MKPRDFTARPGHMPVLDAAGAESTARTGLLLDAWAGERYRAEQKLVDPVAGHIPGAISAPTADNVTPDGTFRSTAELAARFAALGAGSAGSTGSIGPGSTVAAYCGSGVTAAHEVLALALAGIPAAACGTFRPPHGQGPGQRCAPYAPCRQLKHARPKSGQAGEAMS